MIQKALIMPTLIDPSLNKSYEACYSLSSALC